MQSKEGVSEDKETIGKGTETSIDQTAEETGRKFNAQFYKSFKGIYKHGGDETLETEDHLPKRCCNVEFADVEYTPLQVGCEYLSQVLLFEAAKLKEYFPEMDIPDTGKVVMKINDEMLIQDYCYYHEEDYIDADMTFNKFFDESFANASSRYLKEIVSYQKIQKSNLDLPLPYLFDFGCFVLLEGSRLKFSGLFMVMSYIEPDKEIPRGIDFYADAKRLSDTLKTIGVKQNSLYDRNIVVSNGITHLIDFSGAKLKDLEQNYPLCFADLFEVTSLYKRNGRAELFTSK